MTTAHDTTTDLDSPIPFALTAKALAFLDLTTHPVTQFGVLGGGPDGWACGRCGFGWFGPVPDDGLCTSCKASA